MLRNATSFMVSAAGLTFLLSLCPAAPGTAATKPRTRRAPLGFTTVTIEKRAKLWWARAAGDLNGDGVVDLAVQDDNGHGGAILWYRAPTGTRYWTRRTIAEKSPEGGVFASGDLDAGDIDNDWDIDILAFEHQGEWDDAKAPTRIYWYSNPLWRPHLIGTAPHFVKDVNLVDFNGDGKLDLATITYIGNTLTVFRQDSPDAWVKAREFKIVNLHEGMDVGDIDGDGDPDIATCGYWVENPGGDLTAAWKVRSIAAKWHNQRGDWSRNATKVFCRDLDGDGRAEIFISHSERRHYPLAWYSSRDPRRGGWVEHVIADELPAAHTLQVFDMDCDGDYDVLTGVNKSRAEALGIKKWPVTIFLNEGDNQAWKPQVLTEEGIYNGQVVDYEGDGDFDIFRLPTHDAKLFELMRNKRR